MPKSSSKRKSSSKVKHRNNAVPITLRLNRDAEFMLQITSHQELFKLENKIPDERTWHMLTARLNIGSRLSLKYTDSAQAIMLEALDCMREIFARFQRVSKYGATDKELNSIKLALNLTDDMQRDGTARDLRDAINYVFKYGAID